VEKIYEIIAVLEARRVEKLKDHLSAVAVGDVLETDPGGVYRFFLLALLLLIFLPVTLLQPVGG
jgi:hypothetical protein